MAREGPRSGLLRLPEDLVDLGDLVEQLLRLPGVGRALRAGRTGQLGRLVEQLVQPGGLLEVRGLEVVGPQHPEVVLDQLGPLLLDQDRAGAELGVLIAGVLLDDRLARLGLDAGLSRVVDAARQVAVSRDHGGAGQVLQSGEQTHAASSLRGSRRSSSGDITRGLLLAPYPSLPGLPGPRTR